MNTTRTDGFDAFEERLRLASERGNWREQARTEVDRLLERNEAVGSILESLDSLEPDDASPQGTINLKAIAIGLIFFALGVIVGAITTTLIV